MKQCSASRREVVELKNSKRRQRAEGAPTVAVVTFAWMGTAVCSLIFMYFFQFGLNWMAPWVLLVGISATVIVLREGQRQSVNATVARVEYSAASRCIWKLDSEG